MRRIADVLFILAATALGDPITEVADRVLATFEAKGDLKALAEKDNPDPWLVVDKLCRRGQHDAAGAFAKAAPRFDVEKLSAYVESRRGKAADERALHALVDGQNALGAKKYEDALAALRRVDAQRATVIAALNLYARADALRRLRRWQDASGAFQVAADRATKLGWVSMAVVALRWGAYSAHQRSDWKTAQTLWERRLPLERARKNGRGVSETLNNLGITCFELGAYDAALGHYGQALTLMKTLKAPPGTVAMVLVNMGQIHRKRGELARALECYERARVMAEKVSDRTTLVILYSHLGFLHSSRGEFSKALESHRESLKASVAAGDRAGAASALGGIGNVYAALGDYAKALDHHQKARRIHTDLGDRAGLAGSLGNMAQAYDGLGEYAKARTCQEQSLKLFEAIGNPAGVAYALNSLGITCRRLGDNARSLDYAERALREAAAIGDRPRQGHALINIGNAYHAMGAYSKAIEKLGQGRAVFEKIGNPREVAVASGNLGGVYSALGEYDEALDCYERSITIQEQLGVRSGVAVALSAIGTIHVARKDYAKAAAFYERSRKLREEMGARAGLAGVLANMGSLQLKLGDEAKARELTDRALKIARRLGATSTELTCLWNLAYMSILSRKPADAVRSGRAGIEKLPLVTGRLTDELAASARDEWAGIAEYGAYAGRMLDDPAVAFEFLESARAGSLLESLSGRRAIHASAVPEDLRRAEQVARAKEASSLKRYRRALEAGENVDDLWAQVEAARVEVLESVSRIQRVARLRTDLVYPKAAALADVQKLLREDEALVVCVLLEHWTGALVVDSKQVRFVDFGDRESVVKAARAFVRAAGRAGVRGMRLPPHETVPYLKRRLESLVIEPLALDDGVRRVLVAPAGELAYVPFSALTDREVVFLPSATTYKLLHDEAQSKRGERVLALGDPVAEERLPASAVEAKAVGDTILIGKDATPAGLSAALKEQERWRAVHLACHGIIDLQRPALSELTLTGKPLRCLDLFGMKIPADLVVLSACETGKGKLYATEGVVGWTRAFMFAGSPRVIVSLWKVDDAATRALMEKFYELWNPASAKATAGKGRGMGAATALKKAQKHVAAQPQWKHPYFWAAWQLWGLGE